MSIRRLISAATVLVLTLGIATASSAQESETSPIRDDETERVQERADRAADRSRVGLGLTLGGAVSGFTDSDVSRFADTGAGWEGRLTIGTRTLFGMELAYVGTANDLNATGLDQQTLLLSNGAEALGRLNVIPDGAVQPYVVGGLGWKHYDIVNTNANTSSLLNDDDVLEAPVGGGIAYRHLGFIVDTRGMWRPAIVGSDMFSPEERMSTWSATLQLGAEF